MQPQGQSPGQAEKQFNVTYVVIAVVLLVAGYFLFKQVFQNDSTQKASSTQTSEAIKTTGALDFSTASLTGVLPASNLPTKTTLQGNTFNGAGQLVQLTDAGILPVLDGSNLTNVKATSTTTIKTTSTAATTLNGQAASYYTNADNISSGTLDNARLNSSVTLQGNSFNGASQLLQLTAGGLLPVLSGANLTSVNATTLNSQTASYYTNATNIASGTLSDSRLSTNVALLNSNNTFTGTLLSKNTTNSSAAFQVQNSAGVNLLTIDTTGSGALTLNALGSSTYSDEFNSGGPTADAKWTFSTPGASGTYNVNSTTSGKLRITADATNHDCWVPSLQVNCLMLLETPPTGDFQAEVKIDTTPTNLQAPGITAYKDANNYIRFEYEYASGSLHYYAHKVIAGVGTASLLDCAAGSAPVYLRVLRSTDTWTLAYSTDGNSFTTCGSFSQALDLSVGTAGVGPSYNGGTGAAAFAGDIDYFRLTLPNSGVFKTTTANLFQNAADSTTSFRVQNSAGTTILGIDTVNSRIFSSIADSASAIGFTLNTASLSTTGAKLISIKNNGSEKFAVDKDGRIATALVPSTRVYNSGVQSLSDGGLVALTFDSERYDTDSLHDTSVGNTKLTASVSGNYYIFANVAFANNSDAPGLREATVRLGGTTYILDTTLARLAGQPTTINISGTYYLSAGQYIECVVWQNSGAPLNTEIRFNATPEFGMTYLGP